MRNIVENTNDVKMPYKPLVDTKALNTSRFNNTCNNETALSTSDALVSHRPLTARDAADLTSIGFHN